MRCLLLAALLAASPAFADSEARQGSDWVRVTANPCKDEKVLAHLVAGGENPLDYHAARAEVQGVAFEACWKPMYDKGVIFIVYSDADKGMVPISELKPVKEA